MKFNHLRSIICLLVFTVCLFIQIPSSIAMTASERNKIVQYATMWFNAYNPAYNNYAGVTGKHEDSNFVSQAILETGYMFSNKASSFMDSYGCIFDRDFLENELYSVFNTDKYIIKDRSDIPSVISAGDIVFFKNAESHYSEITGVILITESDDEITFSDISVAYHIDSKTTSAGDVKYFSEMLLIYGKAVLYHFK